MSVKRRMQSAAVYSNSSSRHRRWRLWEPWRAALPHDFNNLLSVMMGFASIARQRLGADDPLQESMGMIEESAQRAAELTRQLLGFARPEPQQVRPVCVQEVLSVPRVSR